MEARRIRFLRSICFSLVLYAPASIGLAHPVRTLEIPLSAAVAILVPPGSFVAYLGTVNNAEKVKLPEHGSDLARLSDLLSDNGLTYSVSGYTYTISPAGSPSIPQSPTAPPTPAPPQPSNYTSPGFAFAPPTPPQAPVKTVSVGSALSPVTPVSDKPVNLYDSIQDSLHSAAPVISPAVALPSVAVRPLTSPPPPPPPLPVWTLASGTLVSKDLALWGTQAGWQVQWNFPKDVVVPANTTIQGEFPDAVKQVVMALRQQMQLSDPADSNIHADTYPLNHVIIINSVASEGSANDD